MTKAASLLAILALSFGGEIYGAPPERRLFSEVLAPSVPEGVVPTDITPNRRQSRAEELAATVLSSKQLVVLKAGAAPITVEEFLAETGQQGTQRTLARIAHGKEGLSVAFVCFEDNMLALKAGCHEHDQDLSGDDSVEIRIDIGGSGRNWFQISCNSLGVVRDERVLKPRQRDTGWNLSSQATVKRLKDRWTAVVSIPFRDLGLLDDPANSIVQIRLARRRYAGDPLEHTTWARRAPQRRTTDGFRPVLFTGDQDPAAIACISLSRGELTREGTLWKGNRFKAVVRNLTGGKQVVRGKAIARHDAEVLSLDATTLELAPGTEGMINLGYQVAGRPGEFVDFTIAVEGNPKALYQARWPVMYEQYSHTAKVPDPMFEELLSTQPMSAFGASAVLWQHPLNYFHMRPIAKRMGLAYSPVQVMTEMEQNGVTLLTGPIAFTDYREMKPFCRQTGLKICYYPIGFPDHDRYILTDKAVEGYLQQVADVIDKHGDVLWGIFAGDEQDKRAIRQPFTAGGKLELPRHEVNHPIYTKVDAEVKAQYGFGKFGAPLSLEDNDPFRRIAYYRYANARMRERHRKLRELVKQKAPELVIMSTDPVAGLHPYEFSLQRDLFDVFTHQTSPRGGNGPVITKLVADLTGKDMWPCGHIEGSRNTVEDVRLIYSRLIAHGATGFHAYFAHLYTGTARPAVLSPYFSSPPRFNAFLRVCRLMQSMRKLAFPEKTALALFYSNYSNMADPGSLLYPGQRANFHGWETQRAWGMLVRAKNWFRFTDEHLLEKTMETGLEVLYLPKGAYQDRNTFERIKGFLEKGGAIVCTDPTVFSHDIDGTETSDRRQALFGLSLKGSEQVPLARVRIETPEFFGTYKKGETLELTRGPSRKPFTIHRIEPEDGVTVLARFEDNSPAIITKSVGKGRTFYFAFNPFGPVYHGADRGKWLGLFRGLNARLGIEADCDIWRFELPAEKFSDLAPKPPKGMCLSNNFMYWDLEQPVEVKNVDTGGSYTYSLSPDQMMDSGDEGQDEEELFFEPEPILFSRGDLTDRHRSYREFFPGRLKSGYCKYDDIEVDKWAVAWKDRSAFDITFDLMKSYPIHGLRLLYSGQLPETTLCYKNGDGEWIQCASTDAFDADNNVHVVALKPATAPVCRYLKLQFGTRAPAKILTLTEVEIWGVALRRSRER